MDIHRLNGNVKVGSIVRVHHPGFVDKHGRKFLGKVTKIDPSGTNPYTVCFLDDRAPHTSAAFSAKHFTLEKE